MLFSGENFFITPKTQQLSFVFDNLFLNKDGIAEVGFSGAGYTSTFLFSGKKVLDPNRNYVYSYEINSPIKISGDIQLGSQYRYFIDDVLVADGQTFSNTFSTEKFIIKTKDCSVFTDTKLSCPKIDYEITFDPTFVAGGKLNGKIKNKSDIGFRVFGSSFLEENVAPDLTGLVSGNVPANSELNFELGDDSDTYVNDFVNSVLVLDTSFGTITKSVSSSRISGSIGNLSNINSFKQSSPKIIPYFSGSGNAEGFHWLAYPEQEEEHTLFYESYDEDGNLDSKNLKITLENVSPVNNTNYTGTYTTSFFTYFSGHEYCITGHGTDFTGVRPTWKCSGDYPGSGRYSQIPTVRFLNYSKVTGITFNSNNIFTQDTPEKIPILFSGYPDEFGTGASGFFLTEPFQVNIKNYLPQTHSDNTPDSNNTTDWRRITGVEITNQGTGYTKMPAAFAATGFSTDVSKDEYWYNTAISGTGYDVGRRRSPYVYQAFEAKTHGQYEAAYLTGIPEFVLTGNGVDAAYLFSGVIITNPGSGYEPINYKPKLKVNRLAGDWFGAGVADVSSGEFLFNTGNFFYAFENHWDIRTGSYEENIGTSFKVNSMLINNKYSGSATLPAEEKGFFVKVYHNNSNMDEPLVAKLTIEGDNDAKFEHNITGKNYFSPSTGLGHTDPPYFFDGTNFYVKTYFGS